MRAELLYQCENITGEAVTWLPHQHCLLWVDIEGKTLFEYDVKTLQVKQHHFLNMVTSIIPHRDENNCVILALQNKLVKYNLLTKHCETLIDIPTSNNTLRTNDGKAAPDGQIWFGVMHLSDHRETGYLYSVNSKLEIQKRLNKQCIPNGIVWNKNGDTMYYADSGKSVVYQFHYDKETQSISSPCIAIEVPDEYGIPDGMTIDSEDRLWIAHWGGFGVYVWDPKKGELIQKIEVPVPNVASCTFGGIENKTLFITTARAGLSQSELEKYPLSGSLLSVETNVVGGQNHYPFCPT